MAHASATNLVARAVRRTAALSLILSGCSGGGSKDASLTAPPVPVLTTVTVSLSTSSITVGQTATASANGFDQNGAAFGVGTVAWSTGSPSIASITNDGVVTGVSSGQVSIVATIGAKIGQQSLTVTLVPVATLTMAPTAATVAVGGTQQLTATPRDASNIALTGRVITWSSSDPTRASVSSSGLVTGIATGVVTVTATSEGKTATATITVGVPSVSTVTVAPSTGSLIVGGTLTLTASALDANGNILTGRVFTWTSSNLNIVSGTFTGNVLSAQGVSAGTATVTATSEGKSGSSVITVTSSAQVCSSASALQLSVGQVVMLTAAQKASLCLGLNATSSEYVLIPFNNSTVAANTVPLTVTGTNTSAIFAPPLASDQSKNGLAGLDRSAPSLTRSSDWAIRERERRDLAHVFSTRGALVRSNLTNISPTPAVGSIVQLNASSSGNLCTAPKQLHPARVVAVLPHTIVLIDTLAPAGGYTNAELTAFGIAFDTLGYGLDTLNFGAPTDVDANGRVAIFFTPGVNQQAQPAGGVTLGYFTARDLFPATASGCIASNEGEMFYIAVPDPNSSINGSYTSKSGLANTVLGTLVHEFQHLINAGRRIYVNNATVFSEEVWLNEGLSHIAEELLYYRVSGNSAGTNIGLSLVQSTQAQLNALNTYQLNNLGRLLSYMVAPETNSPYAQNDNLETRGAIWQLLRYSADRKGGPERNIWSVLANSTTAGQANFNTVFGDIVTNARDWTIAQFVDDAGLGVASNYTNPSWNFRTLMPAVTSNGAFPLLTHALLNAPINVSLSGGGAAYFRFRVSGSVFATISGTSSGQPAPSSVDFILVRTQ